MKKFFTMVLALTALLASCASAKKEPEVEVVKPAPVVEEKLTPHQMIVKGKYADAKKEFTMPSPIDGLDEDGNTVLHIAARLNNTDMVKFLLTRNPSLNIQNKLQETPLITAIANRAQESAKLLLEAGADPFAVNSEDQTALQMGLAASKNYYDIFITKRVGEIHSANNQNIVHYLVTQNDVRGVTTAIKNELELNLVDDDGNTPLALAFHDYNNPKAIEIAAALIQAGVEEVDNDFLYFQDAISSRNPDMRFDDNMTPLHLAAAYGHTAIAQYLLQEKADTNVQNSAGSTPLHEAVRSGNTEILKMILEAGANVNAQDNLGKSPVMVTMAPEKMEETYKLLASYGADLNQKDAYGDTLIHIATMLHAPTSVLQILIEAGADVNSKNKEGVTPFEIAIQHQDKEMTAFYANHDADIHTKDTHGISPLMLALAAEDDELFEMTVSKKNVQSQDSQGNTPFHIALLNGASDERTFYILSLTENVNIRNSDGNSPLYLSIIENRREVGEKLLQKGADIFSTNKDNDSPLRIALREGGEIREWLITPETIKQTDGSGNTCLHFAAEWEYEDAIRSLVDKGADAAARNSNGENVLFSAVKTNNVKIIETVVKCGTPVNERDNLGSTPLHMAVRWNATKSIVKLLEMGIDINAQNTSGKSALSECAMGGNIKTARVLLDNGADVNSSDINGCTILMDAVKAQNKSVVKMLLEYNANASMQDINGVNAYHEAAKSENISIIQMIRNAGGNPLSRDKSGNTPFSLVMNKDIKIIKAVLGSSKNVVDGDGNSPIHIAVVSKASTGLLNELIKMGYPIDSRNADGYTALTYAVEENYLNAAQILLEQGANPFQSIDKKGQNAVTIALDKNNKQMIGNIVKYAGKMTDIQGNTILHYAAKSSSVQTVKDLLSYGLEKKVKNVSGDTPYTIAVRWKKNNVAELLK